MCDRDKEWTAPGTRVGLSAGHLLRLVEQGTAATIFWLKIRPEELREVSTIAVDTDAQVRAIIAQIIAARRLTPMGASGSEALQGKRC